MKHLRMPRRPASYAAATHRSPYWVVRYPHQARFKAAAEIVRDAQAHVVLDYGAGDGHLFHALAKLGCKAIEGVGYEPVGKYAELFREHTGPLTSHGFDLRLATDLKSLGDSRFDAIVCMSVLEHLPMNERQAFYAFCDQRLAPGGRVVIEVPIEGGLSLLIKEAGRVLLKRRRPEYSMRRLLARCGGVRAFDPARFDPASRSTWIQHHTEFDHRLLREELKRRFGIVQAFSTPFPSLPPFLGNQEAFYIAESLGDSLVQRAQAEAASTPL